MPTLWDILEREDKARMDALYRYQEAVAILRQQDKSLLLEACNLLDGISPMTHSISLTIRNLLHVIYPDDERVKEQKERAEIVQGYLDHAEVIERESRETLETAYKEVALEKPGKNYYHCNACRLNFSSKYMKRSCPECKSKNITKRRNPAQ